MVAHLSAHDLFRQDSTVSYGSSTIHRSNSGRGKVSASTTNVCSRDKREQFTASVRPLTLHRRDKLIGVLGGCHAMQRFGRWVYTNNDDREKDLHIVSKIACT